MSVLCFCLFTAHDIHFVNHVVCGLPLGLLILALHSVEPFSAKKNTTDGRRLSSLQMDVRWFGGSSPSLPTLALALPPLLRGRCSFHLWHVCLRHCQFAVAWYLAHQAAAGNKPPSSLPADIVPPSKRSVANRSAANPF